MLFVLREKIIALLRGGESRVLLSLLVGFGRSKTRKHLASRITFLELGFFVERTRVTEILEEDRNEYNYTSNSFPRADIRINISSLCHLNRSNKKKKKRKREENGRLPSFPPINLIHLALLVPLEKKSKDQGSYGWQAS